MEKKILLMNRNIKDAVAKKLNIPIEDIDMGINETMITEVKDLTLQDTIGIEELQYFLSLETLSIKKSLDIDKKHMKKNIILPFLPNVKEINIINIDEIEKISFSNCPSIETIRLININNLMSISGLIEAKNLKNLFLIGTYIKDIELIEQLAKNKANLQLNIDILMLPVILENMNIDEDVQNKISWVEKGRYAKNSILTFEQGKEMYLNVKEYIKDSLSLSDDMEKLQDIYIKLNHDFSFNEQLNVKRSMTDTNKYVIELSDEIYKISSSAYYMLNSKIGDTDAFVNLYNLIFSAMGYITEVIYCCIPNDFNRKYLIERGYTNIKRCNHLLIKIKTEAGWLYMDPVIDSIFDEVNDTFLKTKKEIIKKYYLPENEKDNDESGQNIKLLIKNAVLKQQPAESVHERQNQQKENVIIDISAEDENATKLIEEESQTAFITNLSGTIYQQIDTPVFTIGRSKKNSLVIGDNINVGRFHCKIIRLNNTYMIEDNHSKNKTYINEKRVLPGENNREELKHMTKIRIANEDFIFIKG